MTHIELPTVIASFFAAKGGSRSTAALACFTQDAKVNDKGERQLLQGASEIGAWLEGTVATYNLTSEVVSVEVRGGLTLAGVVVAGDFPGSPYKFEYEFPLTGDKISEVGITPIGSLAD